MGSTGALRFGRIPMRGQSRRGLQCMMGRRRDWRIANRFLMRLGEMSREKRIQWPVTGGRGREPGKLGPYKVQRLGNGVQFVKAGAELPHSKGGYGSGECFDCGRGGGG